MKKNILFFIYDYDNTLINCDSEFLWNYFIMKIGINNENLNIINIFIYKMYNKKKFPKNFFYLFLKKKFFLKLIEIYYFLIKIFKNNLLFNLKYNSIISTSTYNFVIYDFKKILNKFIISTKNNMLNLNSYKIKNIKKINNKKFIIISDSINDIYIINYYSRKILYNPDKILYNLSSTKIINFNIIYK